MEFDYFHLLLFSENLTFLLSPENALVEVSDKGSLLAIAWDQKVQVAKLLKSELKVIEKWTLESPAVGLAWLGDQVWFILHLLSFVMENDHSHLSQA